MKYICLIALVILLAGVQSQVGPENCTNFMIRENCTSMKFDAPFQCCWIEATNENDNVTEKICEYMNSTDTENIRTQYLTNYTSVTIECAGRYLLVASLMALFFIF